MVDKKEKQDLQLAFIIALCAGIIVAGLFYQLIRSFRPTHPQCVAALTVEVDHWWEQAPEPECVPSFVDDSH